jgi:hypothetical protein
MCTFDIYEFYILNHIMKNTLFKQIKQRFENTKFCIFKTERVVYVGTIDNTKTFYVFSVDKFNRTILRDYMRQYRNIEDFKELNKCLKSVLLRSIRIKRIIKSFKKK